MQVDMKGRTALITGGSKGLGLAAAVKMASNGANVAIVAREAGPLAAARERILATAPGARVLAVQGDVTSAASIVATHDAVVREFGGVDILLNNAGRSAAGPFVDVTDAAWDEDIQLKLMATVRLTRLVWPGMVERRWGRVVNVLNTYAKAPVAGSAPTAVTRAAQMALTKVLAGEGGPHNILVNALLIGLVKSDQVVRAHAKAGTAQSLDEYMTEVATNAKVPLGRMGEAEEFANIACFLASDAGSYINGTAINVDGGMAPVV